MKRKVLRCAAKVHKFKRLRYLLIKAGYSLLISSRLLLGGRNLHRSERRGNFKRGKTLDHNFIIYINLKGKKPDTDQASKKPQSD